tara:strand:+ start:1488 stop:1811 length:324 start_codon:yes stop_codon:yes gene_type:complete
MCLTDEECGEGYYCGVDGPCYEYSFYNECVDYITAECGNRFMCDDLTIISPESCVADELAAGACDNVLSFDANAWPACEAAFDAVCEPDENGGPGLPFECDGVLVTD